MSTILTHALTGVAITAIAEQTPTARTMTISAICGMIPDLDGIGYMLGIPYGSLFGHRGLLHSLTFAVLLGAVLPFLLYRHDRPWLHFLIFFLATAPTE